MKIFLLLSLFILMSCSGIVKEDERQIIKDLVRMETELFMTRDTDRYMDLFYNDENSLAQYYGVPGFSDTLFRESGYDEMKAMMHHWREGTGPNFPYPERENWRIHIEGSMAWVHFDSHFQMDDIKKSAAELRILVKRKGQWKFMYVGSMFYDKLQYSSVLFN